MAVSIVAAIFLVFLYILIFFFSGQDGEASGSLSHQVTEVIVEEVQTIARKEWSAETRALLISYWEHPVRKLAHFSEYTAMGILVFLTLWTARKRSGKKGCLWNALIILWVFLSAALDEWHQTYVSGRCGNWIDVLIDTSGGCFGLALSLLTGKICNALHARREKTKG